MRYPVTREQFWILKGIFIMPFHEVNPHQREVRWQV